MRIYTYYVTGPHGLEAAEYYHEAGPVAEAKGGAQTQSTSTEPWSAQKPYLTQGFEAAKNLYDSGGPQYYQGSTVTPYSPETLQALDMRTAQATDPNSLLGMAGGEAQKTLRGDYLSPSNPVYRDMMAGVTRSVRPGVDTAFEGAGRFGSPAHAEALARGISTGMLPYLANERARQYDTAMNAPAISGQIPGTLAQVGAAREAKSGENLAADIARYNFEQNAPQQNLQTYLGNISGNYGGTTTKAVPGSSSNPYLAGAGGAMSGAQLGSAFGPWGTGVGAALGGGGGYLAGK